MFAFPTPCRSVVPRPVQARRVLAAMAALLLSAAAAWVDITLDVQPTRTQVYLGETFVLNVVVNGADAGLPQPDLSALKADVRPLGSQSNSRHSISIINGHITRESSESRLFAFEVKPLAAGALAMGPVSLTVNGNRYAGQGPPVQVTGVEQQDSVLATVRASSQTVMVEEPFTITLSLAIAALAPPFDRYEPILPSDPPHLDCPYLNQADIPGLKTPDLQKVLQDMIQHDARTPAFTINNYTSQAPDLFSDPFNFAAGGDPFRPRPVKFRLSQKPVTLNGRNYREYSLALSYTPRQEGDYTFGPVALKGAIIGSVDAAGQPASKQIFAIGPAVTVRVVPPPETNRPDWFIGSVGRKLAAHAELDAALCKVGDPLTLTLDVTGELSLGNMRPPLLNLQPELTTDFRIYDDNVETTSIPGGKRFRYRIRPIREGTLELPPIKVACFDTDSRTYKTARTEPLPVQARPNTQIVSDSGDGGTNRGARTTHLNIESANAIPAAITVVAAGAQPAPLLSPTARSLPLAAGGPLTVLLAWTGLAFWRQRARFALAHRRARALPHALALLHASSRTARPDAAQVARAIRAFLAERLDVAGAALTAPESRRLLQARGVPADLAVACGEQLARLDQALYRPDGQDADILKVVCETSTLLPRIAAALDRPPARTEVDP